MVKIPLIIGTVVWGVALANFTVALADPVTDADLRGKKICWNGGISTYGKDGSYDGQRIGHGAWSLAGDMLTISGANGGGASTITKDNGTFHLFWRNRHGDAEAWGHYCN
ncbi:MAG: hypothetical protein WBQ45_09445 [Roseiarcus sp.]